MKMKGAKNLISPGENKGNHFSLHEILFVHQKLYTFCPEAVLSINFLEIQHELDKYIGIEV